MGVDKLAERNIFRVTELIDQMIYLVLLFPIDDKISTF